MENWARLASRFRFNSRFQFSTVLRGLRKQQSSDNQQKTAIWRSALFAVSFSAGAFALAFNARVNSALEERKDRIINFKVKLMEQVWLRQQQINQQETVFERIYDNISAHYKSLMPIQKLITQILAINAAVFLAWRVPAWRTFMYRHFVHIPGTGRNYTMVTSCFSHENFWHFALNMMVLNSWLPNLHKAGFSMEQSYYFNI